MSETLIEWTRADDGTPGKTWNPVRGCRRVSPGCENCYAERIAARFSGPGLPYEGLARRAANGEARWTGQGRFIADKLDEPLRWKKPCRIFVNSQSDLFFEAFTDTEIDQVFAVMLLAPQHTFMVLTKRPIRMREYLSDPGLYGRILAAANVPRNARPRLAAIPISNPTSMPARWIWLGVSVENQQTADERIPVLLGTPAGIRFLSCEPLLGPIDFRKVPGFNRVGLDLSRWWVIGGGESGKGARPWHPNWARSLRDRCAAAGVPFFWKQNGEYAPADACDPAARDSVSITHVGADMAEMWRVGKKAAGRLLDGVEHNAFPEAKP